MRIHANSANLRLKKTRLIYSCLLSDLLIVSYHGADERMLNRNEYSKRKIPADKDEKKTLKFSVLELFEQVNLQSWSTRLWTCKSCSKVFKNDPVHLWQVLLALEIGRHLYFEKRRKTHEVTGLLTMFPVQGIGTNFKRKTT